MDRRLSAILAADVVGYSRLMERDEAGTFEQVRSLRKDLLEPWIAKHHGRIFKLMGDGLLAEFASAVDAVACGVILQREMGARNTGLLAGTRIELRIGVNLGDVIIEEGDCHGEGVNIAARLQQISPPGGIVVSRTVVDHVKHKVAARFVSLGEHRLKNINQPIEVFRVTSDKSAEALEAARGDLHNLTTEDVRASSRIETAQRNASRRGSIRSEIAIPLVALVVAAGVAVAIWAVQRTSLPPTPEAPPLQMSDRPSVAVLAFRSEDATPGAKELAQGLASDIVYELARNGDLRVVSEHSSFAVTGIGLTSSQIGERLRSRYLVDGTARQVGNSLLLRVQLIHAQDGRIVWAARQETDAQGLVRVRDALTQRIAGTLHTSVRLDEISKVITRPPASLDVYAKVWRAVALKHQYRPDATREARRLLNEAIAQDSQYAPAWAYLGIVNALDASFRLTGDWTPARADEIVAQAQRAIALDPNLPTGYVTLADGHSLANRHQDALQAARRCAELGPSDTQCLQALGWMQLSDGDPASALKTIELALELSPVPPFWITATHADILWALRRYDEALREASDCLRALPTHGECGRVFISSLVESGRVAEARERMAPFLKKFPDHTTREWEVFTAPAAFQLQARVTAAARAAGVPDPKSAQ